jgi:putative ABC transport system substrate-binding protein
MRAIALLYGELGDPIRRYTPVSCSSVEIMQNGIRRAEDIAPAFDSLKGRADALYITTDGLLNAYRLRISILALGLRLSTMHGFREFGDVGGLMSYGANYPDLFRRAAGYVDRILKGMKPGELPVEQPTKFELYINLKTAKALGLNVPNTLVGRADKLIE